MRLLKCTVLRIALLLLVSLPVMTHAQTYFTSTADGDVNAGFRKTGSHQENYEMVVYLGNIITNFMELSAGTQINLTNYTYQDLTNMCPDNLGNLQWSAFSSFEGYDGALTNSVGVFPVGTVWYTVPRTNATVQTKIFRRLSDSSAGELQQSILAVSSGANQISQDLGTTNSYNNPLVVLEPISFDTAYILTAFIGDRSNPNLGDFGGDAIAYSVENVTSNKFTVPAISDFYMVVPNSSFTDGTFVDPITGLTNGFADYLGYFTLNTNGAMTFTRASAVAAPTVGTVTSTVTNGFSPLTVVFTNTASGSITNWVWNFGNGTIITNTTGANVTNTYTAGGNYSVTLTVYGPGGSSTVTLANYIVASKAPAIGTSISSGHFTLSGVNCPPGVQYRILSSTNLALPLAEWTPVLTNTFTSTGMFSYTNTAATSATGFYQLVSP